MSMYKKLILGSPGTGKTTRLLEIAEEKLREVKPDRIAFFSFTKKAVGEAIERASLKFNLPHHRLRNFRTLHSVTYRELGLTKYKVLNYWHMSRIAQLTGVKILAKNPNEDELTEKGDRFLYIDTYARSVKRDVKDVWNDGKLDVDWYELKLFLDTYNNYKQENGIFDFTSFLEQYIIKCEPLPIDIAIIDEAQDLSPLQWETVWKLTQNAKEIYIAGDDDQAVYKWSGADIDQFLNLGIDEKEVLPVSYRLPKKIFIFANTIVNKISMRYDKSWQPTDKEGVLEFHNMLESIDFSVGEWLILVRSNYQAESIKKYLKECALLFKIKDVNSVKEEHYKMIMGYVQLQKGLKIKDDVLNLIKESYKEGREWYQALGKISAYDREYYRALLRRNVKLNGEPKITINTMHGSKGGECEKVLVISDLSKQTYDNYKKNADDEHRVFYVACTRAKKELHILTPSSEMFYEFR